MESLNNENMWEKMAKQLANEASVDEEVEFDVTRQSDEVFKKQFDKAAEAWELSTYAAQYGQIDADAAFAKINAKIQRGQTHRLNMRIVWSVAASVTLLLAVGLSLWGPFSLAGHPPVAVKSVEATHGTYSFTLADGSVVDLNKGSQLSFPEKFESSKRNVKLTGEAFFDVAPDKSSPFFIEAGDVTVRVVGTSFNVKAMPGSQMVEVTVERGIVEVTGKTDKVTLTKGLRAVFDASTGNLVKSVNGDVNYNAWKTRKLVFDETQLDNVLATLQSVYHVQFAVDDASLLNNKLTATFNDQSADNVSRVIALTFKMGVERTDAGYVFKHKR